MLIWQKDPTRRALGSDIKLHSSTLGLVVFLFLVAERTIAMKDSIIKNKKALATALNALLADFQDSHTEIIFKEYRSDVASISIFYCDAFEQLLYFLAHRVAGSYQIAFSVVSAVSCYFFKHSEIPLFEISLKELIKLGLPRHTKFGTIRQVDLCDSAFRIFIQSKVVILELTSDRTFDFKSVLSGFFEKMEKYIQEQPLYNCFWLLMFLARNADADLGSTEMGLRFNQNYKNAKCLYSIVLVEVDRAMVEKAVGNEAVIRAIDGSIKRSLVSVGVDEESEAKVKKMKMESVEDMLIRMYGEVPNFAPLDKLRKDYNKLRDDSERKLRYLEKEKRKAENTMQKLRNFIKEKGFDPDKL